MRILFLHGWHSTPGGIKPTYLSDHGYEVLNPALPECPLAFVRGEVCSDGTPR